MWFVDHAKISVQAGDGGRGCVAFSQPPYTRTPYPDGGDGGDGGDVVIRADPNIATLLDFHFRHQFRSGRGGHGGSNTKVGKRGGDLTIQVPVGTVIHDVERDEVVGDLTRSGDQVLVARGGRGGVGNATRSTALPGPTFKRAEAGKIASRPLPRPAESDRRGGPRPAARQRRGGAKSRDDAQLAAMRGAAVGHPGEQRQILLELKLIADVGLVGVPNAGKSSLLARISTARPKVAAYPFTTRYPVLGVVDVAGRKPFVACDIPGLIEGAHQGKGLGIQFLRHIERTRLLVHLIDMAAVDGREPLRAYQQLNQELAAYSAVLSDKPQVIAANKMDLPQAAAYLAQFEQTLRDGGSSQRVWPISCATGVGIPALLHAIDEALARLAPVPAPSSHEPVA